jgi:hypothetical protein
MGKQLTVKRDNWCRHRTPFTDAHPVCKAGVNFHAFPKPHNLMPCLGETPEAKGACEKYSGWTQEEIDARESEIAASFERIVTIRREIIQKLGNAAGSGTLDCPCCKTGMVHFSRASNGHVHAKCSTDKCASWME